MEVLFKDLEAEIVTPNDIEETVNTPKSLNLPLLRVYCQDINGHYLLTVP